MSDILSLLNYAPLFPFYLIYIYLMIRVSAVSVCKYHDCFDFFFFIILQMTSYSVCIDNLGIKIVYYIIIITSPGSYLYCLIRFTK